MTDPVTTVLTLISYPLLAAGLCFFVAGTVGLLRFPDVYSRLHAVTKADTLGLGLVVAGLSLQAQSLQAFSIMVLIWLLVMASGATVCQVLARFAREREGSEPATPDPASRPTQGSQHGND